MRRGLRFNEIAAFVLLLAGFFCFPTSDLDARISGGRPSPESTAGRSSLSQGSASDALRPSSVGSSLAAEEIMNAPEEKTLQPQVMIMDSLSGGIIGGMAGAALTRNVGYESQRSGWKDGFGVLDIVLIFGCIHGLLWLVRRRGE